MDEVSRNTMYERDCLAGFRRKLRTGLAAAAVIAAVGIALSIRFCFAFCPFGAIAASGIAGWICIFLLELLILPARNRTRHYRTVLSGERETYTGSITIGKGLCQLQRGVNYYPVTLRDGDKIVSLFIYAPFRKEIGDPEGSVNIIATHGFILSLEVLP